MDIVSDLPFTLKLIQRFPTERIEEAARFCKEEKDIWEKNIVTLSVEENEEIDIYFNSEDKASRLYLEALDIVPIEDFNVKEDEEGRIYKTVSDENFTLYKNDSEYDALRVDTFKIAVICCGEWYYGTLQVLPKPIAIAEWRMMRDDLEKEIRGLSRDIIRRSIGANISSKMVYHFLVMKKYSNKVMMALTDISQNPRSEIQTIYEDMPHDKGERHRFDAETVKRYVVRSGSDPTYRIPVKSVNYDTQENRILKMIILDYEKKLGQFIKLVDEQGTGSTASYERSWNKSLTDFKLKAMKLRKMAAILKEKDWYSSIQDFREPYIPHSFILDSRYNLLYQMYLDLRKDDISVELTSELTYTWKSSSSMYEIWCYLKICRIFMSEFEFIPDEWNMFFSDKVLFPLLEDGKKIGFVKDTLRLEVVYNMQLPLKREDTSMDNPLYMAMHHSSYRNHNRPDILVHIYDDQEQWYLGTIILECKYRKLNSFWTENSSRSSRGQFEAYYNNARSSILFGGIGKELNMRPVTKVIVLTPDNLGDGKEQTDFEVLVKGFKASDSNEMIDQVKGVLFEEISRIKNNFESIRMLKGRYES